MAKTVMECKIFGLDSTIFTIGSCALVFVIMYLYITSEIDKIDEDSTIAIVDKKDKKTSAIMMTLALGWIVIAAWGLYLVNAGKDCSSTTVNVPKSSRDFGM